MIYFFGTILLSVKENEIPIFIFSLLCACYQNKKKGSDHTNNTKSKKFFNTFSLRMK